MAKRLMILAALAALGLGLLIPMQLKPEAEIGAGFAARLVCSCIFAAGRSLDSCRRDLDPGMEAIRLEVDETARRVTASVPLLARKSAIADPKVCRLEN